MERDWYRNACKQVPKARAAATTNSAPPVEVIRVVSIAEDVPKKAGVVVVKTHKMDEARTTLAVVSDSDTE